MDTPTEQAKADGLLKAYVAHYSEVALKGKNRPEFARALRRNIARALSGSSPQVFLSDGRFLVYARGEGVEEKLARVFGVAWCARVARADSRYGEIRERALDLARRSSAASFMVASKRSDKSFPMTSADLEAKLGSDVVEETGKRVDLGTPGLTLYVDVTKAGAFVYSKKTRGPGGLPVGTSGRVVLLFSGGIDSPAAAWLLMKRGCKPVYLHFYLSPSAESVLESKIPKLLRVLSSYGGRSTLVMVPFAGYQLATATAPEWLEPSLFRRFMRLVAEELAPGFGASGIATGDALGQAASQTLWNLGSFDYGATLPIMRPLLTYDKDEVVTLARRIGTYEISLEEYKDCCAIVTRHPRTRVPPSQVSMFEEKFGLHGIVAESLSDATLMTYDPSLGTQRTAPLEEVLGKRRAEDSADARQKYKQGDTTQKVAQIE